MSQCMANVSVTAHGLLQSLVGQQFETVTGPPNTVLAIDGDTVMIARSALWPASPCRS
jgi:hypothetical protein